MTREMETYIAETILDSLKYVGIKVDYLEITHGTIVIKIAEESCSA